MEATHKMDDSPEAHDDRMQAELDSRGKDDSPEAHDAQMQAEMDAHAQADSPQAHDAKMQAEIDAHNSKNSLDKPDDPDDPDPSSPDSPEAHDQQMEATHKMDDSPEAHDDRMQADIDSRKSETIDKMRLSALDAAPDGAAVAGVQPEANNVLKKARTVFATVPQSSSSYGRAKEVLTLIEKEVAKVVRKDVSKGQVDPGAEDGVPNHYTGAVL